MSLDNELTNVQRDVPKCVAVGLVDVRTGTLLAIRTVDSPAREALDLAAAAAGGLFRGQNAATLESLFKRARGVEDDGQHSIQEIIVVAGTLVHVFQRGKRRADMVLVTVCRASASLGLVLARARAALPAVEAAA